MPIPRYKSAEAWPPLSAGFRPFFLLAGVWACISMILWIMMLGGMISLPTAFDLVTWHFHEFLFGVVFAVIVGYLMTAIPNWTGHMPLQGVPLGALVLLWLAGRVAVALSAWQGGAVMAALVDLSFPAIFTSAVAREIVTGRNWRNLPVLVALLLLTAANVMVHAGMLLDPEWIPIGERLAISVVTMLIALTGGRIIPSFTASWLRRRMAPALPAPFDHLDRGSLIVGALALLAWTANGLTEISGTALLVAAAGLAVRLTRWQGQATRGEPMLWVLHVGYAWLPIGFALLGAAAWWPETSTVALHALTAGAMGTMILAVMTRVALVHGKCSVMAGPGTVAIYLLVLLAAVTRLSAFFLADLYDAALMLSGGTWTAAFTLFVLIYGRLFICRAGPRPA